MTARLPTAARPGFGQRWRELSRSRLSHLPAHTEWTALQQQLEALYEAVTEGRAFEWSCSARQRISAQDWCVSQAFRGAL